MVAAGEPILGSLWVYAPNQAAAIFFSVIYGISTNFHLWQCCYYKAFGVVGLHPFCAALLTAGYALRTHGATNYLYDENDSSPLVVFINSQVFVYVAPPLLELANYHVLGRVLSYVPHCAPISPNRVLLTFGGLMGFVEMLNGLGVSFAANPASSKSQQSAGGKMIIAALALQLVIIMFFFYLSTKFQRRCAQAGVRSKPVKTLMMTLYASMGLILIRCIYRLAEHAVDNDKELDNIESLRKLSPMLRYEAFFYVFEATLMFINSVLWNVVHPGRYISMDRCVYLAPDGTEARDRSGKDNRLFIAKLLNVLTFGLLFPKKKADVQFDELS